MLDTNAKARIARASAETNLITNLNRNAYFIKLSKKKCNSTESVLPIRSLVSQFTFTSFANYSRLLLYIHRLQGK